MEAQTETIFFDENWDYIRQCAQCRAKEIAAITHDYDEEPDYEQEIYIYIWQHAAQYIPRRGKPTTYIAMLAKTAKKRILRQLNNRKNQILREAQRIDDLRRRKQ